MKGFKSIIVKLLTVTLLATGIMSGVANASSLSEDEHRVRLENKLDVNNLPEGTTISDRMTYDQMVEQIAKDKGITILEAQREVGPKVNGIQPYAAGDGAWYRTFYVSVPVTSSYSVGINFYCSTQEWGNRIGITEVLNTSLNRSYNGISKQFGGSVYTNLENANTIYYLVDGDFYNNGTISVNGSMTIEGTGKKFTFGLSYSSNHYAYVYKDGRYYVAK